MAAIKLEAVRKVYGSDVLALSDFSLDISDGEFVVFVGPSGCGKSTALKILAGLEATTSGRVSIGGEDVTDLAPGKRDIAMVFQNYALYPHLSVRKNIGFGLKVRGTPKPEIDRRVDEVAKILGITALLGRRPRALSGGQRQRVALGRAIVREPQAFLMDEPLSNLDARLRVQMRAEISALHDRLKVTTIYVTHDQTEAMTMADRIVIMRDGIIQQVAEPDEMYEQPANIFVAGFIGSPAMNFFQSTVERTGDGLAVKLGETVLPIRSRASVQQGQPVIVGLRPESIGNSADAHVAIEIAPRLVESLGGERYLYFPVPEANAVSLPAVLETDERNSGMMIARILGNRRIRAGEPVRLTVDPAQLHLFDPGSERALGG